MGKNKVMFMQIGSNAVYVLFIADSLKQVN